ncbi:MAG: Hpt domain-containing protein [Candidatus Paceibacterota bacterium]
MNTSRQDGTPTDRHGESVAAINPELLFTNCVGSVSFALRMLKEFESSGMVAVETMAKHAAAADCTAVAGAAHSLKGVAGIIGAEPLRLLAAKIEAAGETADIESIADLVGDIRQEMERCLVQIPIIRQRSQLATS